MSLLKIQGVSKDFKGLHAVVDVSFNVNEGEIVGLIGPNGAGKTTLFNLISRFLPVTTGRIFFEFHEITKKDPATIGNLGVARTFQLVQPLLELTVAENVMIGAMFGRSSIKKKKEAMVKAEEILEYTGLYKQKDEYAKVLGTPGRKRLELARALAGDPKVLLLDEVMAGLTPTEVEECMELIRKINSNGITILMVEHVMRAVMNISHRIVVLNYGRLIAEGIPEEISNNQQVIEVYLGKDD